MIDELLLTPSLNDWKSWIFYTRCRWGRGLHILQTSLSCQNHVSSKSPAVVVGFVVLLLLHVVALFKFSIGRRCNFLMEHLRWNEFAWIGNLTTWQQWCWWWWRRWWWWWRIIKSQMEVIIIILTISLTFSQYYQHCHHHHRRRRRRRRRHHHHHHHHQQHLHFSFQPSTRSTILRVLYSRRLKSCWSWKRTGISILLVSRGSPTKSN